MVWGTPAVVFCVLTVCLVVPLVGYSDIMESRRFSGLLFPFLSLLWLRPFQFMSLESPLFFLVWLESLFSLNRNSSDRMCLFSSFHIFFHLRIRPAACNPLTLIIRSSRCPGMLGMAPLLLVSTLEWSGIHQGYPLYCLSSSKSSCREVFNSLSTVCL